MDYERVEQLSKKLFDARIETRARSASNLLFKIESNLATEALADGTCVVKLLDGILQSLQLIASNPSELTGIDSNVPQLLENLLRLLQVVPVPVHIRQTCVETNTKILEVIYQLGAVEGIGAGLKTSLEKTVDALCGLNTVQSQSQPTITTQEMRALELMSQNAPTSVEAKAAAAARYQGAGAILNSRLVYTGWKFPAFMLTERDERWLFDAEVAVKLNRPSAARELWAVLSELPAPALLQKTNLLHAVLDLVGAPHSQVEIDADPLGLHKMTALRWLERLVVKCGEAFRVQLEGSLCCQLPPGPAVPADGEDGQGAADLATGLTQAMYAFRHPLLPTDASQAHGPQQQPVCTQGSLVSLYPAPSFPGLAFACCAAALPLLQSDSTEVCRLVHSLLKTCLPYLLEPKLAGAAGGKLLPVEHGRLQHLFNRVEQLLAFHGEAFNMDSFLELMASEDPSDALPAAARRERTEADLTALGQHSCQLLMQTVVVDVLRSAPVDALLPVGSVVEGEQETRLCVGAKTLACLSCLAAGSNTVDAVLPGLCEAAQRILAAADPETLQRIRSTEQALRCAAVFAQLLPAVEDPEALLRSLVGRAEAAVGLLDAECTVQAPAVQAAFVGALPILLVACCESESDCGAEVDTLCAVILRVLACGSTHAKTLLLGHITNWVRCMDRTPVSESPHARLVQLFELLPRHGRHLLPLLATPAVAQALVVDSNLNQKDAASELSGRALELLELLSTYLMGQELQLEDVKVWSAVLLPLKALEWEPSQVSAAQSARFQFARRLQDACADADVAVCSTAFAKSLVLGMFHSDSAVRINSTLRVRRDLLHVPLPSALGAAGVQDGAGCSEDAVQGLLAHDLFGQGAILHLQSLIESVSAQPIAVTAGSRKSAASSRGPAATSFTHDQVRKLAAIGFGDLEAGKRATALGQMLEMLGGDPLLMRTVHAEWAVSTAQLAILQLEDLVPFADQMGLVCSAQRLQGLTDAQGRLLLETARLVRFLFTNVALLRQRAVYLPEAADRAGHGVVNVGPVLRVLLAAAALRDRKSGAAVDAVRAAAPFCALTLWLTVCTVESWQPALHGHPATAHIAVVHSFVADQLVATTGTDRSVHVPSFLAERFLYPAPHGPASEYSTVRATAGNTPTLATAAPGVQRSKRVVLVALEGRAAHPAEYPPDEVVQTIVRELTGFGAESVHMETATKLFGLIIEARNHAHLRAAMSSTLCVCAANAPLLHAFLYLKINFLTAASGIITVAPQTQKDHVSLAAALDFLQASFAALFAQRGSWPKELRELVLEYHNETAAAILPQMTEYLADNFQHANAQFVGLAAATEEQKERFAVSHAVCTSYFRLLHTLSAFRGDGFTFGAHMTGSFVTTLLVHIGTSELHAAHDRAVALSVLENLVRHHEGGWHALNCIDDPHLASGASNAVYPAQMPPLRSPSKDARLRAGCVPEPEVDVVDCLVRAVRLVRTPDSMQGTSAVLGVLRLLHASLVRQDELRAAQDRSDSASQPEKEQWKWLTRLLYDRRSEVKVLAVETLGLILRRQASRECCVTDLMGQTADSLDPEPAAEDTTPCEEELSDAAQWPPYEVLRTISNDDSESVALRTRAIALLAQSLTSPAVQRADRHPALSKLGSLFCAMHDCLSLRESIAVSTASIRAVLAAVYKLITCDNQRVAEEALGHARSLKLLPLVVEVLNVRTEALLGSRALARVCVFDEQYVPQERACYFHGDHITLRTAASSAVELQGAGWAALLRSQQATEVDGLRGCRTAACWLLYRLEALSAVLFEECVAHSSLIHHLVTCFSSKPQPLSAQSPHAFAFDCDAVTAQAELLSMLITREGTSAAGQGPTSAGSLQDFVGRNPLVPGNLMKKLVLVLLGLRDFRASAQKLPHQLRCIGACLRLLSLMMNEPLWRQQLGVGEPDGIAALSDPCAYLFGLLLTLRTAAAELAGLEALCPPLCYRVSEAAALVGRLDFSLALFMQHSRDARLLFLQQSLQDKTRSVAAGRPSEAALFEQHVRVLVSATEKLSAASSANTVGVPAAGGTVASAAGTARTPNSKCRGATSHSTPGAVRGTGSGAHGKLSSAAKSPATVTAGTPTSGQAHAGHKVNQSLSSWATRTSQGSKWRDKSRGYVWNASRSEGRAGGAAVESALSERDKLQLWSSLLVLSSLFPNNEQAVDWAIELQLHQTLNKLLRYAAVHCKSALLHSSIASAALFGAAQSSLWAPSDGMVAAAVGALCAAFTHNHAHAKQCFASTGEAAAAVLSSASSLASAQRGRSSSAAAVGGNAASLHHLVTLGTWKGTIPVTRWLYLSLAGSILSGARSLGAPALKSTFSHLVALSLQRSLHASHADPEAVVPLLTTLTSFLSVEEDVTLLSQLSRKDQGGALRALQLQAGLAGDSAGAEEFKAVTFPELVQWVWGTLGQQQPAVAAALCKCLGRLGVVDVGRKAMGNLLSEDVLRILCECYAAPAHPQVGQLAALALWPILHYNEKAKGTVRDVLTLFSAQPAKPSELGGSGPGAYEGEVGDALAESVERARACIQELHAE